MRKRRMALAAAILSMFLRPRALAAPVEIDAYMSDPCGACTGGVESGCGPCHAYDSMMTALDEMLRFEIDEGIVRLELRNVYWDRAAYDRMTSRFARAGVAREARRLPVFFIGDSVLIGAQTDAALLRSLIESERAGKQRVTITAPPAAGETADTAHSGESIIYISVPNCADCAKTDTLLSVIGGLFPNLAIIKCDLSTLDGMELASQIFALYEIPKESQLAPSVAIGGAMLTGYDSIEAELGGRVRAGNAKHTRLPPEDRRGGFGSDVYLLMTISAAVMVITCAIFARKRRFPPDP